MGKNRDGWEKAMIRRPWRFSREGDGDNSGAYSRRTNAPMMDASPTGRKRKQRRKSREGKNGEAR